MGLNESAPFLEASHLASLCLFHPLKDKVPSQHTLLGFFFFSLRSWIFRLGKVASRSRPFSAFRLGDGSGCSGIRLPLLDLFISVSPVEQLAPFSQ